MQRVPAKQKAPEAAHPAGAWDEAEWRYLPEQQDAPDSIIESTDGERGARPMPT